MSKRRWLLLGGIVLLVVVTLATEPGRFLNLDYVKSQQVVLQDYAAAYPWRASAFAFGVYTAATALSIPGAIVMTLAAGAVFGLLWGTVIVSFASTIGACCAFLLSRYLFRGFVQARFGHRLEAINRGVRSDGPFYLLTLRLIPIVPFIAVNLLLALTPLSLRHFYLFSQLGMLPATLIYVNAGTRLGAIEQLGDVVSAPVLVSLGLLAALPFVARWLVAFIRRRRFRERFPPPPQVERNVVVIGAGSAGLVASYIAAAVKARVTLVEQGEMGGDCLNTGCVPSKALLAVARRVQLARNQGEVGLNGEPPAVDFPAVMRHVRRVVDTIAPHDSVERYRELGVECVRGRARLVSPYEVAVGDRRLSTRAVILATGASPLVPPLEGLDAIDYLTSDNLWDLEQLPRRLLVLGGGPIGCELAQAFARLGSEVTLVEMAARLLPREDPVVSALIERRFNDEGIRLLLSHRGTAFARDGDHQEMRCVAVDAEDAGEKAVVFDRVLIALGRRPNLHGFGLEELVPGVELQTSADVNEYLQTRLPNVYACGDVAGPYQFTHVAAHQAWYAAVNALFGDFRRFAVDYRVIPWCTFTDPEVARVGVSEAEARERRLSYEVTEYPLSRLDRAVADHDSDGFVRVITAGGSDRILGATIVGAHAGEMIAEFVLAMKHNLGLNKLLGTIHVYPTLNDANKLTAGAWRRAHTSPRVLRWLRRYHRWRLDRAD